MSMDYEDQERLNELLQKAFDAYLADKFDSLLEKHLPLIDAKIKSRIDGTSNWTPELNTAYSDRIKDGVHTVVGNYLRVNESVINGLVLKAIDAQLEETVKGKVQFWLNRRTDAVMKALKEDKP